MAYDDASTDATPTILENAGFCVLRGAYSRFKNELLIRQELVDQAKIQFPETDWFFILDSDEILLASREELVNVLLEAEARFCDGVSFHLVNLWKNRNHFRTDELFDKVRKVHAWRNGNQLIFSRESGLHNELHPTSIKRILDQESLDIVHLGFSSWDLIVRKFNSYKYLGQRGRMLWRLIDERGLQVSEISTISHRLGERASAWILNQEQGTSSQTRLAEYLWEARKQDKSRQSESPARPLVTLVCLIYEGVDWLEFAYGELLRLQRELHHGVSEILFCANDPTDEVVDFLQSNSIPHIIFRNENPNEHYLSRVYRAYNHAVEQASGEYCLLVNSDMAYSPGFLTRMLDKRSPNSLVVGQLVESGTLKPGPLSIKKNFGRNLKEFNRLKFERFALQIKGNEIQTGGLFMPLLVEKSTFLRLGAFPEGNLVPSSLEAYLSGGSAEISKPGYPCISGDAALFEKAKLLGLKHLTNTYAVAYHFQEGEKRHSSEQGNRAIHSGVSIANDSLNGINNERVLWNVLVDVLRNAGIKVFEWNTGKIKFSLSSGRRVGKLNFSTQDKPRIKLQNATYLPLISGSIRNIALLQDQVSSKKLKKLQDRVLIGSNTVITNSIDMIDLDAKSHYIWQPLPINDLWLETPLPASRYALRTIFVGALDSTKGWAEVKEIIYAHREIEFIVVSKYGPDFESNLISKLPNVQMFHQITQPDLVSLMDTCELFILGSPFETQCLAAMEAASRNLAVVMRPTGILGESPNASDFGYFSENLADSYEKALKDYSNSRRKNTRDAIQKMYLSSKEIEIEWLDLLSSELRLSFMNEPLHKQSLVKRLKNRAFRAKRIKLND